MTELVLLRYPNKSHRKRVVLPRNSAKLAEFVGIMLGDGGIGNPWQATITVSAVADRAYVGHVTSLCTKLFSIAPAVRKRKRKQALVICLTSTSVVDFLVSRGLHRGNKLAQGLTIPAWIMGTKLYKKACLRGLVDTDGCIFVHRHTIKGKKYENIGLCFTSYSPQLLRQVASIFEEFGIMPHIDSRWRNVYLYREDAVDKYLRTFGTSNDRIKSVYKNWRGGRVV